MTRSKVADSEALVSVEAMITTECHSNTSAMHLSYPLGTLFFIFTHAITTAGEPTVTGLLTGCTFDSSTKISLICKASPDIIQNTPHLHGRHATDPFGSEQHRCPAGCQYLGEQCASTDEGTSPYIAIPQTLPGQDRANQGTKTGQQVQAKL